MEGELPVHHDPNDSVEASQLGTPELVTTLMKTAAPAEKVLLAELAERVGTASRLAIEIVETLRGEGG